MDSNDSVLEGSGGRMIGSHDGDRFGLGRIYSSLDGGSVLLAVAYCETEASSKRTVEMSLLDSLLGVGGNGLRCWRRRLWRNSRSSGLSGSMMKE